MILDSNHFSSQSFVKAIKKKKKDFAAFDFSRAFLGSVVILIYASMDSHASALGNLPTGGECRTCTFQFSPILLVPFSVCYICY
jgi:hypothetical protein